jgi:hypothetical protein
MNLKICIIAALRVTPLTTLRAADGRTPTSKPTIPAWHKTDGKLEAKVAPYMGRNVIFVNDKPLPPLMCSGKEHSRETWLGQPRKSIEEFTSLDYEIFQTDTWLKYSLSPGGGKLIKPVGAAPKTVSMPPYSCQYFALQTGAPLNAIHQSSP